MKIEIVEEKEAGHSRDCVITIRFNIQDWPISTTESMMLSI